MKTPYFVTNAKGNKKHFGSLIGNTFYVETNTTKKVKIPEAIWNNLKLKRCKAIAIANPDGLRFHKFHTYDNTADKKSKKTKKTKKGK